MIAISFRKITEPSLILRVHTFGAYTHNALWVCFCSSYMETLPEYFQSERVSCCLHQFQSFILGLVMDVDAIDGDHSVSFPQALYVCPALLANLIT